MSSVHLGNLFAQHVHLLLFVRVGQLEEDFITSLGLGVTEIMVTIASDSARQFHVFFLDGKSLGVDSAQIGVLEQAHDVGLGGFLESNETLRLEAEVGVKLLGDVTN